MIVLALTFVACLVLGVPVAFAMGASGIAYLLFMTDIPLVVVPQRLFTGTDGFVLMALPLFVLAGNLMTAGRLSELLVGFVHALVGHMKVGLAQVNTVQSMIFGGISGAAVADIAAEGPVLLPLMKKDGYDMAYASAVTAATACMGPIIPPSIPMVIYGVVSGTSIGALFLAGAIPGVLIGIIFMVYNYIFAGRHHHPPPGRERARFSFVQLVRTSRTAILVLALPLIIIGGITGGIFTPTEAAGVAAAYAFVVAFFVLRTLRLRDIPQVLLDSAVLTAAVMLVVAMASLFSWIIAVERVPVVVADVFTGFSGDPRVFLGLVILLLLFFGTFLEPTSAIIILTPVLLPVATRMGIDPVHFGAVMVIGMVIGLITPPVGLCLFVVCGITRAPFVQVSRASIPFVLLMVGVLVLVAYVPPLTMWLPGVLLGP